MDRSRTIRRATFALAGLLAILSCRDREGGRATALAAAEAKIDAQQAIAAAVAAVPGSAQEVRLLGRRGRPEYVVSVLPSGEKSRVRVEVDATTGRVTKRSAGDDDDDDELRGQVRVPTEVTTIMRLAIAGWVLASVALPVSAAQGHGRSPLDTRQIEQLTGAKGQLFLHYWGTGSAEALARGLRAAIDHTSTRVEAPRPPATMTHHG